MDTTISGNPHIIYLNKNLLLSSRCRDSWGSFPSICHRKPSILGWMVVFMGVSCPTPTLDTSRQRLNQGADLRQREGTAILGRSGCGWLSWKMSTQWEINGKSCSITVQQPEQWLLEGRNLGCFAGSNTLQLQTLDWTEGRWQTMNESTAWVTFLLCLLALLYLLHA